VTQKPKLLTVVCGDYCHCIAAFVLYCIAAVGYRIVISDEADRWFTRAFIPDSEIYKAHAHIFAEQGFSAFVGLKNYLAPTLMAYLMADVRYGDLILNILFVGWTGIVVVQLLRAAKINSPVPIYLVMLNPATIYYSQGYLKEIPSLLVFTVFLFSFIRKRYLLSIAAIIAASIVRSQIGLVLGVLFILRLVPPRWKVVVPLVLVIIAISAAPLLYSTVFFEEVSAAEAYRLEQPGQGLGRMMEEGMFRIPLFGIIALPIRIMQNLFEPFPNIVFYEKIEGSETFNIFSFVLIGTALLMAPFYVRFFSLCFRYLRNQFLPQATFRPGSLLPLFLFCAAMVSLNPFIHQRYIFFFQSLLCVSSFEDTSPWTLCQVVLILAIYSAFLVAAMVGLSA
jgi:hypothetical protein